MKESLGSLKICVSGRHPFHILSNSTLQLGSTNLELSLKKKPCLCLPIKLFPRVTTDSFMATTADYSPQPILNYKISLPLPFTLNIISSV